MKNPQISFILIAFLILTNNSFAQNPESYNLKIEKPNFSIDFPAQYKLEESSVNNGLKTELFRAEFNQEVYMCKYTEHKNPAVSGDNKVYMDASLESFLTGIKGTLIKKSNFKFGKTQGLEAYLSLDNKNMYVFYRVIVVKRVQYQIIVITKSTEKSKEINRFFNSFQSPVK